MKDCEQTNQNTHTSNFSGFNEKLLFKQERYVSVISNSFRPIHIF